MVVTISHNKDKNGIEVSFPEKPSPETLAWLKENKFVWSKSGSLWYKRYTENTWLETHKYFNQAVTFISSKTTCDICGKVCHKFGLGTHKRMKHGIVIKKTIAYYDGSDVIERKVNPTAFVSPRRRVIETRPEPVPVKVSEIQNIPVVAGKDLSECKRPDGQHLYTEIDLWILIGKLNLLVFNTDTSNLLGRWGTEETAHELIQDFERRFDCKFSDVKKTNPKVHPAKTDAENRQIALKYAYLNYSR